MPNDEERLSDGGKGKVSGQGPLSWRSTLTEDFSPKHIFIILHFASSVKEYLKIFFTLNLDFDALLCPHCQTPRLAPHGQYWRSLRLQDEKHRLPILRLRCRQCQKTHAVLPDFIAPYRHHATPVIEAAVLAVVENAAPLEEVAGVGQDASTIKRWVKTYLSVAPTVTGVLTSLLLRLKNKVLSLTELPGSLWQQIKQLLENLGEIAGSSLWGRVNIWLTFDDQTRVWL